MRSNLTKSPKEATEESIRKNSVQRGMVRTGMSSPRNNRIAVLNQDDESFQLDKLSFTDAATPKPVLQAKRQSLHDGTSNQASHKHGVSFTSGNNSFKLPHGGHSNPRRTKSLIRSAVRTMEEGLNR